MVEIRISKNTLHTSPGGTFDMKNGSTDEKAIAKLYILQARISKLIDNIADSGELNTRVKFATELFAIAEKIYDIEYKNYVEDYALWKIEFDQSKYAIPSFIENAPSWEDCSWHNDVCPSFFNSTLGLRLFIEASKIEHREYEDNTRFILTRVQVTKENGCGSWIENVFECETEKELEIFLSTLS